MRGLGLVGLLVVVAIIFILWTQNASQVAKTNKAVRPQAEQMAGVDASGQRVSGTYTLEEVSENGRFKGMKVLTITDDSMMKSFYGLQVGDVITDVYARGTSMKSTIGSDPEMMKSLIAEAYASKQPLVVVRNNSSITLQPGAGSGTHRATTNAPSPAGKDDAKSSVQGQLDKITQPR